MKGRWALASLPVLLSGGFFIPSTPPPFFFTLFCPLSHSFSPLVSLPPSHTPLSPLIGRRVPKSKGLIRHHFLKQLTAVQLQNPQSSVSNPEIGHWRRGPLPTTVLFCLLNGVKRGLLYFFGGGVIPKLLNEGIVKLRIIRRVYLRLDPRRFSFFSPSTNS